MKNIYTDPLNDVVSEALRAGTASYHKQHRTEAQANKEIAALKRKHGADYIDELIGYGGLKDLLIYGEGQGKLSSKEAMEIAAQNV